jgi:predicted transcriptional regulator
VKAKVLKNQLILFPELAPALPVIDRPKPAATLSKQQRILEFVRAHPEGVTGEEVEKALHFSHQTVSARLGDLYNLNKICHLKQDGAPVMRRTRSGKSAHVWKARDTES